MANPYLAIMSESELIIMDFFFSTLKTFFWQIWDKHFNLFELHMRQIYKQR